MQAAGAVETAVDATMPALRAPAAPVETAERQVIYFHRAPGDAWGFVVIGLGSDVGQVGEVLLGGLCVNRLEADL